MPKIKMSALAPTAAITLIFLITGCNRQSNALSPAAATQNIAAAQTETIAAPIVAAQYGEISREDPPQNIQSGAQQNESQTGQFTARPTAEPTPTLPPMTLYDEETDTTLKFDITESPKLEAKAFDVAPSHAPEYPISVDRKTSVDEYGTPTIVDEYVLAYDTDIWDVAKKTFVINGVQYAVMTVEEGQTTTTKQVSKTQICGTPEEAGAFPKTIEYNGIDGNGILEIQPETVSVEVHETTKTPYSVTGTKTYRMDIKDERQIPETIKSKGYTLYLNSIKWAEGGDPGTGIIGTETESSYGTYNTTPQSWIATARYSATAYEEKSTYKGTVSYAGTILIKNSPTNKFTLTYKPDTPIQNASGAYKQLADSTFYDNQMDIIKSDEQNFGRNLNNKNLAESSNNLQEVEKIVSAGGSGAAAQTSANAQGNTENQQAAQATTPLAAAQTLLETGLPTPDAHGINIIIYLAVCVLLVIITFLAIMLVFLYVRPVLRKKKKASKTKKPAAASKNKRFNEHNYNADKSVNYDIDDNTEEGA